MPDARIKICHSILMKSKNGCFFYVVYAEKVIEFVEESSVLDSWYFEPMVKLVAVVEV